MIEKPRQVVVVGGGISGLTTAVSLIQRGVKVVLLEKNDGCGGLVNSFTRDGYLFDGGVRALENAGMVKPMLEELEIDIPLFPSDVSVGVQDEIIHVESKDAVNDYQKMLQRLYPESVDDVVRVIDVIKKFDEYMTVLFGSDSPFFKDARRDRRYYFTTFFSWVIRFIATAIAVLRMRMPVEEFLGKLISNRSLNDIISQHFFKATPTFFAMSYFSLYTDYFYPKGGVGRIPAELEEKLVSLGGEVHTGTDVTGVNLAGRFVTDREGNRYPYTKLIWAADLKQLYRIISTDTLSAKRVAAIGKERSRILSSRGAESVFTLFLGVDLPPDYFAAKSRGHFFYTPLRDGLGELQRGELKRMLNRWDAVSRESVHTWIDEFCRLNTYEISIPVLNDPDAAPPGKTGVIISLLLDYALVHKIDDDGWYEEFESAVADQIIGTLVSSVYPDLMDHIDFRFCSSPLSIVERVRSSEGAIVGWSFEEPIPIDASMLNMKNAVKTALPAVFKAGQWAASPAGIPTCIMTAKLAADLVYKELAESPGG